MAVDKVGNKNWLDIDPDLLQRIVPVVDGMVSLDDLQFASAKEAPRLDEAFSALMQGMTVSEARIPVRDWTRFLTALRDERAHCYLMLDFDGVLHPRQSAIGSYFSYLPAFEEVLRDFPRVEVVIASSWRHSKPLNELRGLFGPDLRSRIVGVTPDIPQAAGETDDGTREREVIEWLHSHGVIDAPWIALDDEARLYKAGAPVFVTPDGFGAAEAIALRTVLNDPRAFILRCRGKILRERR